MKKFKKIGSNEVDGAASRNKDWGFKPVPNKGGKTTNAIIITKEDNKNA